MRFTTRLCSLLLLFLIIQPCVSYTQSYDNNEWVWNAIHIPQTLLQPKKKIVIAVIDDGFDLANPLWKNCITKNAKEIPGNNIDDDNNGKTDDVDGWDFADNDNDVNPHPKGEDKLAHGTAVLGILWQTLGKLLINRDDYITILPLKAKSDHSTNNYITEGYKAIEYATAQHADMIVCCWSGGIFDEPKQKILEAAVKHNICIVASAGNFVARHEEYPGAFPSVINVTGVNQQLQKQRACNYGPFVDIAAPADSIATYIPGNNAIAVKMNGSSACTPIVAAAIALLKTTNPAITVYDIDRLLKQSALPLESYNNHYKGELGAGLLNIEKLISLTTATSNSTTAYLQPKSFIKLTDLDKRDIRIKPGGNYATGIEIIT